MVLFGQCKSSKTPCGKPAPKVAPAPVVVAPTPVVVAPAPVVEAPVKAKSVNSKAKACCTGPHPRPCECKGSHYPDLGAYCCAGKESQKYCDSRYEPRCPTNNKASAMVLFG